MNRVIKRKMIKNIKEKQNIKNMPISSFMKKVNIDIPDDQLPIEKINKFALLMKTLQFSILINHKEIDIGELSVLTNRFIEIFKDMRKLKSFLVYKETLLLADSRINTILKSINEDYDTTAFAELDIPNLVKAKINDSIAPFLIKCMQAYVGWYREEDSIFKGYVTSLTDIEAEELQDELDRYSEGMDKKALARCDNLIERLLNLKHKYTTLAIRKISSEIEEEINTLLSNFIHKNNESKVISDASNHFYKLLELRITFSSIYDIVLSKDDLKLLFRACYYYAIKKINDFLIVPDELKELVCSLDVHTVSSIVKLRVGSSFTLNNEHLKTLFLTASLEIPTTGYILDSAVNAIIDKNNKLEIEEFKIKSWNAIKALVLFIDSKQCNKLYRATYAVDIDSCKDIFSNILNGDYDNNKEWFYKLLKKYDIFKMNKKYIAV